MREIKFRGKTSCLDNNEWVYGDLHIISKRPHIHSISSNCPLSIDINTVGQFTGFKDMHGVEIYEGDIIELVNANDDIILVTCEFGHAHRKLNGILCDIVGFYFTLPDGKKTFPICNNYMGRHDTDLFKIVGNIHDNPELIINSYQ